MDYLNQFHKESTERKMKKIQESKNFPTTYEEIMRKQKIREQQTAQLQEGKQNQGREEA